MTTAMTLAQPAHIAESFRFSDDQRKLILDTCCGGATREEATVLIGIAEMRGLNPVTGECYFVKRWDSQRKCFVWAVQVSIDAMRIKAEESGVYAGQDEAEYEYEPGSKVPSIARIRVYRRDWERPCVGVARYSEYVQRTREGGPTKFWADMPHNQLAKCAEALALRKAFPRRLAKLYTVDEMAQASNEAAYHETTGMAHRAGLPDTHPDPGPATTLAGGRPQEPALSPADSSALGIIYSSQIAKAEDLPALKLVMATIKGAADAQRLTLSQVAHLRDLAKARQKILKAGKPVEEVLAGNPMPESWGGPPEAPIEERCIVCEKPLGPAAAIESQTADGVVGMRHMTCANPHEPELDGYDPDRDAP